jgi:hypothetical protein
VTGFPEDFRCHVAWRSTCGRQHVELFLIHDARKPKISDQQVSIVFGRSKEKILRLQIAMYNAMIM